MRVGLDIGSRYAKLALRRGGGFEFKIYDSALFYREFGVATERGFALKLDALGIPEGAIVVATGYGRQRAKLSGAIEISEITAHAEGAKFLTGYRDFTLIDLGGQDTKVVRVEGGKVVDFLTSDRCAASTGRFLENIARVLGISLEELSRYAENPAPINSTCAVFAETEVLEKLSQGIPVERLAAGANYSIVKRFAALVRSFPADAVVATGGVAKNKAVISLLSKELGVEVQVPQHAQFAAAIGCLFVKIPKDKIAMFSEI